MAKNTKKTTRASTARKPASLLFRVADDPDAVVALRERKEAAARCAALIASQGARIAETLSGSGGTFVRAELATLYDALNRVRGCCSALAHSIAELPKLPKSVASGRWTEQWATEYGRWWDAIQAARALTGSSDVAAIMDAGEPRLVKKWTGRTIADLDRLAATLHPSREGGSGLGFIRAGADSLPAKFAPLADAIATRVVDLRSVPESAAPECVQDMESESADDAMPPALDESDCIVLHALKDLGQARVHSAARIAQWLTDNRRAKQRSTRTVTIAVANLVRLGYVERPHGGRRGARLTMKGLRVKDCCD